MARMEDMRPGLLGAAISCLRGPDFPEALRLWLKACLSPDNLTILACAGDAAPRCLYSHAQSCAVHAGFESTYCSGLYLLDPFHALDRKAAAPGVYHLQDVAPDHFHRSEYYTQYYQKTGIVDEMVYLVRIGSAYSVHLCLGRDESSGTAFSAEERVKAALLTPVIQALTTQHWSDLEMHGPGQEVDRASLFWARLKEGEGITLTPRQAQTALLILRGHSSESIATILGVSPQTVKVFRRQIYARCAISSQAELFHLMMPTFLHMSE